MKDHDYLLKVRFNGEAVGPGKISVSHLLRFLSNLNKAFQRTGRVLLGESESVRKGRQPGNIREELALDLALLTHGSPDTVLGFDRRRDQMALPGMDFGLEILEKSLSGLDAIQRPGEALPHGFDAGVLLAWRDMGVLFSQGIREIAFTLQGEKPLAVRYSAEGFTRVQERIKGPETNIRIIEGRLLMADFKEHGTRCRIHPAAGDPVLCLFDEAQKDEVLEDILHFVRIVGEATEDSVTGKISSIRINDIERLEDKEGEAINLLPRGTPISRSFWESATLEELARTQNVMPVMDLESFFGGWPGDSDDCFEEEITRIRQAGIVGEGV